MCFELSGENDSGQVCHFGIDFFSFQEEERSQAALSTQKHKTQKQTNKQNSGAKAVAEREKQKRLCPYFMNRTPSYLGPHRPQDTLKAIRKWGACLCELCSSVPYVTRRPVSSYRCSEGCSRLLHLEVQLRQ